MQRYHTRPMRRNACHDKERNRVAATVCDRTEKGSVLKAGRPPRMIPVYSVGMRHLSIGDRA
jgi:hypothetical protein